MSQDEGVISTNDDASACKRYKITENSTFKFAHQTNLASLVIHVQIIIISYLVVHVLYPLYSL